MKKKKLSARQQLFANEYPKDGNGTKAAVRAGYSKNGADVQAVRLLKKPAVAEAVAGRLKKVAEKAIVDKAYVLTNLKEVTERCMQHAPVMEFDHVEKEMRQKTAMVKAEDGTFKEVGIYEFDSSGANRSLELLGKSMKMFTDKVEVEVTDSLADRMKRARERTGKK